MWWRCLSTELRRPKIIRKRNSALEYYEQGKKCHILHPDTQRLLELLLHMLAEEGEDKTFAFIKNEVLKGKISY